MNEYIQIFTYIGSVILFIAGAIYFFGNFRKGKHDASEATITLLQQTVDAFKIRLDQTSTQITQLNSTLTIQSSQITALQTDNAFFKKLIQEALQMYFKENNSSIQEIQDKLK